MASHITISRRALLAAIALATTALLVGVAAGILFGTNFMRGPQLDFEIPLQAAAAYGSGGYAVASGRLDDDLEGVFFLDALTSELNVAAINPRSRQIMAVLKRNIASDFKIDGKEIKNPKFLLVTGVADLSETAGGGQLGDSIVYVVEQTSGILAGYVIPLPRNLRSSNDTYSGELKGIVRYELRKTKIRPKSD